jgi:YVTN family beta-propeller protein
MHSRLAMILAGGILAVPLGVQAEPFAYVTNAFAPSVSVIDTASNQIAATIAFPPGSTPIAAAITPDSRKVYVTSLDAFTTCGANDGVFVIDTASNTVEAGPIAVECEPTAIAISPDGKLAYVASELSDTISVIETATDAVSATITLPNGEGIAHVAVSPDGQRVYATVLAGNSVFVIDTSTNTVLDPAIDVGFNPAGIAVSPDGNLIYVTDAGASGGVAVIEAASGTVVATIAVDNHPSAVAFAPDGVLAYVTQAGINTEGEFTVSRIDTASSAVVGDPIEVGSFPTSIAITADGMQAYVGNERSNTVSVVDTTSNSLNLTLSGMNSPRGVAASAIPVGHKVPNVVGEKEFDATFILHASGLSVGSVTPEASNTVPAGKVMSQNPLADTYLGSGAAVDLVVSSGRNGKGGGGGGGGATGFELLALLGLLGVFKIGIQHGSYPDGQDIRLDLRGLGIPPDVSQCREATASKGQGPGPRSIRTRSDPH